jgi:hypothetical protein
VAEAAELAAGGHGDSNAAFGKGSEGKQRARRDVDQKLLTRELKTPFDAWAPDRKCFLAVCGLVAPGDCREASAARLALGQMLLRDAVGDTKRGNPVFRGNSVDKVCGRHRQKFDIKSNQRRPSDTSSLQTAA